MSHRLVLSHTHMPSRSRLLSNAHVLDQRVGSAGPDYRDRTRGRLLLASEAMGRSRRAILLLVVGGWVMIIGRDTTGLAEGWQSHGRRGGMIIQGNA